MAEVGDINIDFYVTSLDIYTILVGDLSTWGLADNKAATISVYPPGASDPIISNFGKHKTNSFNSNNLHLSCVTSCGEQNFVPISDGIWEILLEASPNSFYKRKYFLKTNQLQLQLADIYLRTGTEYNPKDRELREDLEEIDFLIDRAKSYTLVGDKVNANKQYNLAIDSMNKYVECGDCI